MIPNTPIQTFSARAVQQFAQWLHGRLSSQTQAIPVFTTPGYPDNTTGSQQTQSSLNTLSLQAASSGTAGQTISWGLGSAGITAASQLLLPSTIPPPVSLEKSLVAGPILAYRYWALIGTQSPTHRRYDSLSLLSLRSLYQNELWLPGLPLVSSCSNAHPEVEEGSPHASCSCGIYGMKQLQPPDQYVYTPNQLMPGTYLGPLAGRVALWGRVIEHTQGYRAQYAYPHTLFLTRNAAPIPPGFPVPDSTKNLAELLRASYGCQVE